MSMQGLSHEIEQCRSVSEARQVCERRGFVPPAHPLLKASFYHPRQTRFLEKVEALGGFSDCHGHADRAYTLEEMVRVYGEDICEHPMIEKWELTKRLERNSSSDDYLKRILTYVFESIDHGVTYIATNIDADPSSGRRALWAAKTVRDLFEKNPANDRYGNVVFRFGAHPHEGFFTGGRLDRHKVQLYEYGCKLGDFCGGLPSRDGRIGKADEANFDTHLDIILQTARRLGKPCGAHIDQANSVFEHETERLIEKIKEHGMQGRVVGVHAVSLARQPQDTLESIIAGMKETGLGLIVCPTAAISMEAPHEISRTGGSIAPITALREAGISIFLGGDNRTDVYNPNNDGDMLRETIFAQETLRDYKSGEFARMAAAVPFLTDYPDGSEPITPVNKRRVIEERLAA